MGISEVGKQVISTASVTAKKSQAGWQNEWKKVPKLFWQHSLFHQQCLNLWFLLCQTQRYQAPCQTLYQPTIQHPRKQDTLLEWGQISTQILAHTKGLTCLQNTTGSACCMFTCQTQTHYFSWVTDSLRNNLQNCKPVISAHFPPDEQLQEREFRWVKTKGKFSVF